MGFLSNFSPALLVTLSIIIVVMVAFYFYADKHDKKNHGEG